MHYIGQFYEKAPLNKSLFTKRRRDCLVDSDSSGCSLNLFPEEDSWHYITVTPTRTERRVEFAINVKITGEAKIK